MISNMVELLHSLPIHVNTDSGIVQVLLISIPIYAFNNGGIN